MAICKIDIGDGSRPDSWIWTKNVNGQFSTKSAHLLQACSRAPAVSSNLQREWSKLWNSKIHERHKILWWQILSNALPIKARLASFIPSLSDLCPLCNSQSENLEHIFLRCDFAKRIWFTSPWEMRPNEEDTCWDWLRRIWRLKEQGIDETGPFLYASISLDHIWRTRNALAHKQRSPDAVASITSIQKLFFEYSSTLVTPPTEQPILDWNPPFEGWIKVNFDVALKHDTMICAAVGRDHLGSIIFSTTEKIQATSPLVGEIRAAILGIKEALKLKIQFCVLEGDSRAVISSINTGAKYWEIANSVDYARKLLAHFEAFDCNFIPRVFNFSAHNLAHWALVCNMEGYTL